MRLLCKLLLAPLCIAGMLHGATVTPVAWSGMPTSGGASTNEWFTGFSNPAINDAGTVAFDASVTTVSSGLFLTPLKIATSSSVAPITINPPKFTNTWTGVWTVSSKGTKTLIASSGIRSYPIIADVGGFNALGSPLLNNSNLCAFAGNYSPGLIAFPPILPGDPITNFYSVYGGQGFWISTNPYLPVAFVGESAPGYTLPFSTSVGTLSGLANLSSTNGVLLSNSPITFTNWPAFVSIDRIALPDTGRPLFSATISATNFYYPPVSTNPLQPIPLFVAIQPLVQHGVWSQGTNGAVSLMIREGDSLAVGSSTLTLSSIAYDPSTNTLAGSGTGGPFLFGPRNVNPSKGDIALGGLFDDGTSGILMAAAGSGSLTLIAHTGDAVPGGTSNDTFSSFGNPDINTANHVAFIATAQTVTPYPLVYALAKPAASNAPVIDPLPQFTNTWSGIWAEDSKGTLQLIARLAPPVPDLGGFTSFDGLMYNDRHQVAFRAQSRPGFIMIPPGSFAGGTGIWMAPNLTNPVAWIGQPAPGYPTNLTITTPSPYSWYRNPISFRSTTPAFSFFYHSALPDTGRLILWATATATNTVPPPPVPRGVKVSSTNPVSQVFRQNGIWAQTSSGSLSSVLREGMAVSVNGKTRTIASIPFPSMTNEPAGGQTRLFSRSSGAMVTPVTFTDGTQAVLTITP